MTEFVDPLRVGGRLPGCSRREDLAQTSQLVGAERDVPVDTGGDGVVHRLEGALEDLPGDRPACHDA